MKLNRTRFSLLSALLMSVLSLASCTSQSSQQAASEVPVMPSTSETSTISEDGVEAYFQQLLSQYGQDCTECLQPLELQVRGTPNPQGSSQTQTDLNVLIALDSSGSMAESITGGTKIDVAKSAIARFVSQLPETTQIGLLVYGHKGSNQAADKAVSCAGIESVYALDSLDQAQFDAAVQSFQPTGYTPIAKALEQAGQLLPVNEERQNIVYVVSDGIETCGGNPVVAAQKLHTQADVIINVIGFDVNNEAQQQLEAVARAGGGKYLSAHSASELDRIFNQAQSQVEQTLYRAQNSIDRTYAQSKTDIATTQVSSCVSIKLTQESARINSALAQLHPEDSNYSYVEAVREKLETRHAAIREWSNRVQQSYRDQRDVTLEQLRQDLETVNQRYGQPTN
ncbi:VWA domain-containing protein [Oscillatoria sp. FACHB-1407]|uniref:vWA domain-containing protein n=1 Tax=Oscillatoria sp. FACHB-1407 TaxID=2692847 RepID=UPI001689189F|nr:VWA domain-containing protein [Oscillatoria sp. FACHB-1407]MBD2461529.1 VWA domain-containing protein [Oscillatoria sp. FACHB-1407]